MLSSGWLVLAELMVWGCFGNGKLGHLQILPMNVQMDTNLYQMVLTKHLCHSMRKTGTTIFQQDGAPCHKSRWMMHFYLSKICRRPIPDLEYDQLL